ncbi:unnamed protein product, partial [Didymodactylos carnosus]
WHPVSVDEYVKDKMWLVRLRLENMENLFIDHIHDSIKRANRRPDELRWSNVEDRVLSLAYKLPKSFSEIVYVYIDYGLCIGQREITGENIHNYRKGFELLAKCLPNNDLINLIKHLSVGIVHMNMCNYNSALTCCENAVKIIRTFEFNNEYKTFQFDSKQYSNNVLELIRTDHSIGQTYEGLYCYAASIKVYFRIIMIQIELNPIDNECHVLNEYKWLIRIFEMANPRILKTSLKSLLRNIIQVHNDRQNYEQSLKSLYEIIGHFFKFVSPPCFARIYSNTQMLNNISNSIGDYLDSLLIFKNAYVPALNADKMSIDWDVKNLCINIENCLKNIDRVIYILNPRLMQQLV